MEEEGHLALLPSSLISRFLRALGGSGSVCTQGPVRPCLQAGGLAAPRGGSRRPSERLGECKGQAGPGAVRPCEPGPGEEGQLRECAMEEIFEGEGSPVILGGDSVLRASPTLFLYTGNSWTVPRTRPRREPFAQNCVVVCGSGAP